ncbi:MAG TPA: Gfo/Idh/MocA family oxidoreductase [Phycisphaeraceae bacterium]
MMDSIDRAGGSDTSPAGPIRVGVVGLGRSGWGIHAETIARLSERFRLVAVAEVDPHRRAEAQARFGCHAYTEVEAMLPHTEAELIVVATPSHLHAQHAIAAMEAGKHVLCEKPMAMSSDEADAMIAVAKRTGRVLTAFHNRRFDLHFLKVRELVESGELGRIIQVRFVMHGFARRWDWQTLKAFGGGMLNNAGPHFLDQLLSFLPDKPLEVFCHVDRALTLGDAEDHCVVLLRVPGSPGLPLVQMELTSACCLPQESWLVMGTRGTLRGGFHRLKWRIADFSHLPARQVERGPAPDRSYNRETPRWRDGAWEAPPDQASVQWTHQRFYECLYDSLRRGAPLVVAPQQVQRQMRVLDACHAQADAWMPPVAAGDCVAVV